MNILLITDAYPPEIRSISIMMQELAEGLASRGDQVTVVTCWPEYNLSHDVKQDCFTEFMKENDVNVIRVKTPPHHKVNFIIRGFSQMALPYLFYLQIRKWINQKIEIVIVYSPPLPLTMLGSFLKRKHQAKYLLNVNDIFPQNAIDLGILRNRSLIKFFEWMENKAYKNADKITHHTNWGREFLIMKKQIPVDKISTVFNWIDVNAFRDAKNTGEFRRQYGLEDKFIFLFPGILGPAQKLDLIIQIAQRIQDISDVCFLFVGDGSERKRLEEMAQQLHLTSVLFKPFISPAKYPSLLKEVDVGLACLGKENKTSSIPGKILGFMASSLPIVAFLNKENDAHAIINESGCGYSGPSDDPELAANIVRRIFCDRKKLVQWGQNGYNYAVSHFSKERSIEKLFQLIQP